MEHRYDLWRIGAKYSNDDVLHSGAKIVGVELEADYVLEQWSSYDHVFLTTKNLTFSTLDAEPAPLPPIMQPKDWVDAYSVRAGGTVSFFDRILEVHGGAFYESSAIPNSTYTIEVVDGDKLGVGTGVSARMWGARVDVAYGHIFYADRVVGQESIVTAGNVAPPALTGGSDPITRVAMGKYTGGLDELNIGLTVAFDELFGFGPHAPAAVVPVVTPPPEAPATPASDPAPSTETAPTQAPASDAATPTA
jgi:hypothetical protein